MAYKDPNQISDDVFNRATELAAQKPSYTGTFDDQIKDIYGRIANREKFSYDVNADPLYQQYKDTYVTQGKLAMRDTMGKAAGLTGGYGSSYGQQVGQQAYDAQLKDLGEVIPELYQMAYQQYQDDGDNLMQQANLLGNLRDTEYSRYRDQVGDWNTDQDRAAQQEQQAYERAKYDEETAYNRNKYDEETAYERSKYDDETNYNRSQQTLKMDLTRAETLAAYGDFSGYRELYGDAAADRMKQSWIASNPDMAYRNGDITPDQYYSLTGQYPAGYTPPAAAGGYGGSGGGDGSGSGNLQHFMGRDLTTEEVKKVQAGLGIEQTGVVDSNMKRVYAVQARENNHMSANTHPDPYGTKATEARNKANKNK